jgi:hypothetical protein
VLLGYAGQTTAKTIHWFLTDIEGFPEMFSTALKRHRASTSSR